MLAALFVVTNHITLIVVLNRNYTQLWQMGVWGGCALSLHLVLKRRLPSHDPYLLPTTFLLAGWGLNLVERLAPLFADRQNVWLLISTLTVIILLHLPHNLDWLRRHHYTWLFGGIGLLATTFIIGVNPSGTGPRLWLPVGPLWYYQPSELLKILALVFLASYFAKHWPTLRPKTEHQASIWPNSILLTPVILMFSLCVLILVWQRDIGTATIFFAVCVLMLYLASGKWLVLGIGGLTLLLFSLLAYTLFDVVALRIQVWLNPWADPDGRSYQIVQSLMAVADGGIIGRGIGEGLPTYIPVVHSDFVFAAIAEEWGLIGVIGLVACLLIIIMRGIRIALQHQDQPFQALLAAGISLLIAVQSLLIIGGTLRLWPLTGVTLPLVSYGGSSLLTTFIAIGLLLIISGDKPS